MLTMVLLAVPVYDGAMEGGRLRTPLPAPPADALAEVERADTETDSHPCYLPCVQRPPASHGGPLCATLGA